MTWPVFDKSDQRLRFSQQRQELFGHSEVFPLIASADVIDLSRLAVAEDSLNRGAVIFNRQPVSPLATVAIQWQGLIVYRVRHEQRDEFFRILVGPIGVAAPRYHHREPISGPKAQSQQVTPRFAGRIRAPWNEPVLLGGRPGFHRSIHLVRAHLDESFYTGPARFFEQNPGSYDIGVGKTARV